MSRYHDLDAIERVVAKERYMVPWAGRHDLVSFGEHVDRTRRIGHDLRYQPRLEWRDHAIITLSMTMIDWSSRSAVSAMGSMNHGMMTSYGFVSCIRSGGLSWSLLPSLTRRVAPAPPLTSSSITSASRSASRHGCWVDDLIRSGAAQAQNKEAKNDQSWVLSQNGIDWSFLVIDLNEGEITPNHHFSKQMIDQI